MPALLGALPWRRLGLWAAAALVIAGAIYWLRADAVEDDRAKASERRIETILKARERRNEVHGLSGDALHRELTDRVRSGPK